MNKFKYHLLGGFVFLGTVLFGYIGYTAYTALPTQNSGNTMTSTIWNNLINTVNDIGARTDGIYSSGGNIGIGTINPNGKLDVAGGITLGNYRYWGIRDNGGGEEFVIEKHNGGTWSDSNIKFVVTSSSVAKAVTFTSTSDERFKKNICSIDSGIYIINKLRGVTFNWKDKNLEQTTQYGFIAQEVEKILPDLVKTDYKGYKSVNYDGFIPILVKALQEQNFKIEKQEKQIDELNKKLDKLINSSK